MAIQHQGPACPECIYFERVAEGHGECHRYARNTRLYLQGRCLRRLQDRHPLAQGL